MAETDWKYLQYNVENGQKRTSDGPSGGPSSLADLDDTSISNPSNGQMLGYDGTEGKWKNVAAPAGSVTDVTLDGNTVVNGQGVAVLTTPNVNDLKDTNISSPSSGQTLQYNATTQKWENTTPASGGNVDDVYVNGESVLDGNKIAQVTSYKEITQAEYEALPDTKLTDGIAYFIKDSTEAEGFPPLVYSTSEREVGVWVDGKPLYQKTYIIPDSSMVNGSQTVTIISTDLTHIDMAMLDPSGTYISTVDPNETLLNIKSLGYWDWGYNYQGSRLRYDKNSSNPVLIEVFKKTDINNSYSGNSIFTIKYTKSTDTPGGGLWAGNGAMAHHYSTEEVIVGTWIDGKPLYERVFDLGADVVVDYSAFANTTINASQMKVLVDAWGIYSTGVTKYSLMANISNNIIRLQTDRNGAAASVRYVVLQYTKTTD